MKLRINIPSSLSEITLGQYQRFIKVAETKDIDQVFLMQKMIQIFCNVDLKDVHYIKMNTIKRIVKDINKTLSENPTFRQTFRFEGIEYGFIPNLEDLTFGEYIDLDTTMENWKDMHKAMSILYRPIEIKQKDRYTIYEYDGIKNEEVMKRTPVHLSLGASVFFYNLRTELQKAILNYSSKQMENELTFQQRETLLKNGVGFSRYIISLKEILEDLEISPN